MAISNWNFKIGIDRANVENVFGYGERNEEVERLLEPANLNELYAYNTMFKHKTCRNWTMGIP